MRLVHDAYGAEHGADMLTHISTAIKGWRGSSGHHDELTPQRLKEHRKWARETRVKKNGLAIARLHAAVLPIARLHRSRDGARLRRLLKIDETVNPVPTAVEELKVAQAANAALAKQLETQEVQRAAEQKAAQKIADAHRKLKAARKKKRATVTAARTEEKRRAAKAKKAALEVERAKLAKRLQAAAERLEEKARADVADTIAKLKGTVSKWQKRAHNVEDSAKLSVKRLRRAQAAEAYIHRLQERLDELMEEAEKEEEEDEDSSDGGALNKDARRDEHGRFKAGDWRLRVVEYGQMMRRTPTGSVGANVRDVLRVYAPHVQYAEPTEREMRKRRIESCIVGECCANIRVAKSLRVISFGSDESTKFGKGLLSTNTQIEPHDAPGTSVDVVQRGCTLTAGGSAEAIAKSIDTNIFSYGRLQIEGLQRMCDAKFGNGTWKEEGGPDPESLGMHRLSENTVIMGDNCSTAEKTKRILIEVAEEAGRDQIGEAAWAAMSQAQRDAKCKAHHDLCQQHGRNTMINAMINAQTESLKDELADSLGEFNSFDRMSTDVNDLIRATGKEMHAGQAYALGKGRESEAWRKSADRTHPHLPYDSGNGRQDLALDGSVALFWNKMQALKFLQGLMVPGSKNRLETFLLRTLSCSEMTAALRVNTLWKYIYSEPSRWLVGKARARPASWAGRSTTRAR